MIHFLISLVGFLLVGAGFGMVGGTAFSLPWFILMFGLFIIDMNAYIKGRTK